MVVVGKNDGYYNNDDDNNGDDDDDGQVSDRGDREMVKVRC